MKVFIQLIPELTISESAAAVVITYDTFDTRLTGTTDYGVLQVAYKYADSGGCIGCLFRV